MVDRMGCSGLKFQWINRNSTTPSIVIFRLVFHTKFIGCATNIFFEQPTKMLWILKA